MAPDQSLESRVTILEVQQRDIIRRLDEDRAERRAEAAAARAERREETDEIKATVSDLATIVKEQGKQIGRHGELITRALGGLGVVVFFITMFRDPLLRLFAPITGASA